MTILAIVLGAIGVAVGLVTLLTRGQALAEVELRFRTPLEPQEAREQGLAVLLPVMAYHQFSLTEFDDDVAIFSRIYRPLWTFYVAALLWPLGLLALLRSIWIQTAVTIEPSEDGSLVVFKGEMPGALREALKQSFAQ